MMSGMIRAKLIDTTNEKTKKYIGEIRGCLLREDRRLFMLRDDGHSILTSTVKECEQDDKRIVAKTLNSTYTLEIVD